jgi:threonine dehydratase
VTVAGTVRHDVGMELVSLADVRTAADVLDGVAVHTPLVPCPWADRAGSGAHLWVKPESLQPIGAFKLRGAYYAISCLPVDVRERGVVTHSSGNHGRAIAYAAREFGVPAVVVMPKVTPPVKIAAVEALGAEIVLVDPDDRDTVTAEIAERRGMSIVPPFDDRHVIAGQGTVGLEIVADRPDVEVVLVPIGGGGLASGLSTAIKAINPEIQVYGVEPEFAAETLESVREGRLVTWSSELTYRTVADGVRTPPSELTFAHIREHVDGIVTVTEEQIEATVGLLAREANLVAEPSGAVAPAAYLFAGDRLPPGRTVAVISGGNLDPAYLATLISREA